MKVAVCDDSPTYISQLTKLLDDYQASRKIVLDIVYFMDGYSLLDSDINEYDVIFLDVSMPGIDGIDTAREIRRINTDVMIVFITSYIEYAPSGYEVE